VLSQVVVISIVGGIPAPLFVAPTLRSGCFPCLLAVFRRGETPLTSASADRAVEVRRGYLDVTGRKRPGRTLA
jgi:hypothetical protein